MHAQLPTLGIHFSDRKYWTLMRLISAAIPNLGSARPEERSPALDLLQEHRSWIAGQLRADNAVVLDDSDSEDTFVEAQGTQTAERKSFEFELVVGHLQGTISRTVPEEQALADAMFENLRLGVGVYSHRLVVDVSLGALDLIDRVTTQPKRFQHLITSRAFDAGEETPSTLVAVRYMSVSPDAPDYVETHGGIDQHINVDMSTLNLLLTRESVLALYDWIITTFANGPPEQPKPATLAPTPRTPAPELRPQQPSKMRIKIKLSEIALRLNLSLIHI